MNLFRGVIKRPMNSRKKADHQVLGVLTVKKIEAFLMECVNLPDIITATPTAIPGTPYATWSDGCLPFDRWLRRWQLLFTFQSEDKDGKWHSNQIPMEPLELFTSKMRTALRRIWNERDARQRDWYFYRLRHEYNRMIVRAENQHLFNIADRQAVNHLRRLVRDCGDQRDTHQRAAFFERAAGADMMEDVPRICPFEAAMYWLQLNQRLMLRCGGPDCAAPYFFRTKKGQKFCSPECADPARRDAKLRWWNESPNSPKNRNAGRKSLR